MDAVIAATGEISRACRRYRHAVGARYEGVGSPGFAFDPIDVR